VNLELNQDRIQNTRQIAPSQDAANKTRDKISRRFSLSAVISVAVTDQKDDATWRAVMINRKHIDHVELLEFGKLLLLLMKRQEIKLNVSSERNVRMTKVEELPRAS
jgi:hypothetical protein